MNHQEVIKWLVLSKNDIFLEGIEEGVMNEIGEKLKNELVLNFQTFRPGVRDSLMEALELACKLHADQSDRPDGPYINHVLRVANRIVVRFKIDKADVIMAAVLHDSLEDQSKKLAVKLGNGGSGEKERAVRYLIQRFGAEMSRIVLAVSIDIGGAGSAEEWNRRYAEHVAEAIRDECVFYVKLSDFMDNALNLDGVGSKKLRQRWARKYLPLYQIFLDRLGKQDIRIPEEVKKEIASELQQARSIAERLLS